MRTLRSYPGVLTLLVISFAMITHGIIDYINYEIASPSILAALGCVFSAMLLVGIYEVKGLQASRKLAKITKV